MRQPDRHELYVENFASAADFHKPSWLSMIPLLPSSQVIIGYELPGWGNHGA